MRASEILRKLADVIDSVETGGDEQSTQTQPQASLNQIDVDHTDNTEQNGTFVPPLQAKIELLKKAVNVDSTYDQHGPDEDPTGHGADNEDELQQMKKRAGLNPVVADASADDEPLE